MNGISINTQIICKSATAVIVCFAILGLAGHASAAQPVKKTSNLVDVEKAEVQVDLEAGEVRKVKATCPSGFIVSDGSARIDHVDQGTGDLASPKVLESKAISKSAWQATVKNTASGRAQTKVFAVCLREKTSGEAHKLTLSAPVKQASTLAPGTHVLNSSCAAGTVAVDPGFKTSKPAEIVRSEPAGNGWQMAVKTAETTSFETSIRCLSRKVKTAGDPGRRLEFERKTVGVTVPPGEVRVVDVTCPVGNKAIVGDWDLSSALSGTLRSLGNDPRPLTRSFRLLNSGNLPAEARLSILCVGNRTVPNP